MRIISKNVEKIKRLIVGFSLRHRLRRCRYVHLMYNDKFTGPFVEFLNRNFPVDDHVVLCVKALDFPVPQAKNVFKVKSYFDKVNLDRPNIEKIICHSLFVPEIVEYFYNHPTLQRSKACWLIYGGDLYDAPRDDKNDFVRKNFKELITDTDGDEQVAYKKYNISTPCINAGYSFPVSQQDIDAVKRGEHDKFQIQVNNSCDKSTLEILQQLGKFSSKEMRVTTVLSYGDMKYKDQILECGHKLFGDGFVPVLKYMPPIRYAEHMAQNDVLIMNQDRQQGIGNEFMALALGVKLFIKPSVTTYAHFSSRGIKVYDTNSLCKLSSFSDIVDLPTEVRASNKSLVRCFFDDGYLKSLWSNVFTGDVLVKMLGKQKIQFRERLFSVRISRDGKKRIIYILGIRIRYRIHQETMANVVPKIVFSKIRGIGDNDFCTGCTACQGVCPKGAIKMLQNREGFLVPSIDRHLCIDCGKCDAVCPIINKTYDAQMRMKDVVCYAAQAGDDIRLKSSSGGMFTILAEYVLSRGGCVCGAAYSDDFRFVHHVIIDDYAGLDKLRVSKYVQSDLGNTFLEIKSLLANGRMVLFVGTPCQVAGLKRYIGKESANLLFVDLICCGVPSSAVYDKYLLDILPEEATINEMRFRMKDMGWHSCAIQIASDKGIYRIKNDLCEYEQAHFKGLSTNKICNFCPYDSFNREGDISLGDYWGIERHDAALSDEKGTSLVLVNTKKGKSILEDVKCRLKLLRRTPAKWTLSGNDNIVNPIFHRNRRQFFWNIDKMSLADNYKLCMEDKCDCIIFNNAITEINYGSMLTAYALQEVIMSFGLYAKILNHARVKMDSYEGGFAQRFAAEYFNLTDLCETDEDFRALNNKTETFIVGSDQMWRTCYWKDKVDKVLLDFAEPDKKKIACSISFGVKEFEGTDAEKAHFRKSLESYSAISVREDSGVNICRDELGADATWILDPVFIIDPSVWRRMSERSSFNSRGKVCYYGWIFDERRIKTLERIAHIYGDGEVVHLALRGVAVEDWLSAIRNCSLLVSDSYHGICFAIIFNVPFICISELGQERFDSLARLFGKERISTSDEAFDSNTLPADLDYRDVNRILERERLASSKFLKDALTK